MNIKFHERQSSDSQVCPCGWKEKRTDIRKVSAKAPKKQHVVCD